MPTARSATMVLLATCAAAMAGCAAPVLSVRHDLPAAVPLPEDARMVRVGDFSVHPPGHDDAAAVLTQGLQKRLSRHWAIDGDADTRARAVRLTGAVAIKTDDARGTRRVRRYDKAAGAWREAEVPTLVRTASAHVTCRVARPGTKEPLFAVEADRSYDSTADPQVRGELGLGRPDDPDRVPPTDTILADLLDGCAEDVVAMLSPQAVEAEVRTRGTLDGLGNDGLKAAEQDDLETAVRLLTEAVTKHPDDAALRFDLAAVLEAAGRLEAALEHYVAVLEQTDGRDADAAVAARRVERVLTRRGAR
ncbi:MAG: tetratricopeptide repeat protein [Phycisphaerae bacterium]